MVFNHHFIESIWTGSWNRYGLVHELVHGIHMEWRCNPYGMDHSMTIPYGFHSGYGMRKWLGPQPKVIPYGFHGMTHGFHGFHMEYTREDKDLGLRLDYLTDPWSGILIPEPP